MKDEGRGMKAENEPRERKNRAEGGKKMKIVNGLKLGATDGKGWMALVFTFVLIMLLPGFSAYGDVVSDRTYNICIRQCVDPCCKQKCGYAACIASTSAKQT